MMAKHIYVFSYKNLVNGIKKSLPDCVIIEVKFKEWKGDFVAGLSVGPEQLEKLKDAQIVIADNNLIPQFMYKLPKLKWIQATWAGVDPIFAELSKHSKPPQLLVTRYSGDYFGHSMFDYCLGQIICRERNFFKKNEETKNKIWKMDTSGDYRRTNEITVAILGGCGTIGSYLARKFHLLGARVVGFGRSERNEDRIKEIPLHKYSTKLEDVLPESDYIINVLPSTSQTIALLNNNALKICSKKRPVLINIGRGTIIDENEIIKALDNKWISGAILDVFVAEPLPQSSPLWTRSEVTITPHIAAHSQPADIVQLFVDNYHRFVEGKSLRYAIDWKLEY